MGIEEDIILDYKKKILTAHSFKSLHFRYLSLIWHNFFDIPFLPNLICHFYFSYHNPYFYKKNISHKFKIILPKYLISKSIIPNS